MRDENACHSVKGSIFIQPSTPLSLLTPTEYVSIPVWAFSFSLFLLLNLSFSIFSLHFILFFHPHIFLCLFVLDHHHPIPSKALIWTFVSAVNQYSDINMGVVLVTVMIQCSKGVQNHLHNIIANSDSPDIVLLALLYLFIYLFDFIHQLQMMHLLTLELKICRVSHMHMSPTIKPDQPGQRRGKRAGIRAISKA